MQLSRNRESHAKDMTIKLKEELEGNEFRFESKRYELVVKLRKNWADEHSPQIHKKLANILHVNAPLHTIDLDGNRIDKADARKLEGSLNDPNGFCLPRDMIPHVGHAFNCLA